MSIERTPDFGHDERLAIHAPLNFITLAKLAIYIRERDTAPSTEPSEGYVSPRWDVEQYVFPIRC